MTDFVTADDGIRIAYERLGAGVPLLMIHGFGSSRAQNWKATGWFRALPEAGFAITAMDVRGHGDSDKPHDPKFYSTERLADDAALVLDAVGWRDALVLGYSMGGFIGLQLTLRHGARVRRLALAGVGETYLRGKRIDDPATRAALADAITTPDKSSIADPRGRMFRDFADQPGKDPLALAACMRAFSPHLPPATLAQLQQPVLVVCGADDDTAGRPEPLAAAFPDGHSHLIMGRNHMSAVGDPATRRAVIDFFTA